MGGDTAMITTELLHLLVVMFDIHSDVRVLLLLLPPASSYCQEPPAVAVASFY